VNRVAGILLPLLVAYAATIVWCVERWNSPTQYFAHCWLVPLLAAVVLYRRRAVWRAAPARIDPRGWWLLAPGLALHLAGALLMIDSWSAASLVLTVPGAAWLALGRQRLRGQWPVLGLVLFVVPAPIYVEGRLAFVLKELAVTAGQALGNAFGAGVTRDGDHLAFDGGLGALYVADACSGLRSLLATSTLAYCIAFFVGPAVWWRRAALLAVAVPFAVAANVVRIGLLCVFGRSVGVGFAEGTGHTLANVAEWLSLVVAVVAVDAVLTRLARRRVPASHVPGDRAPALSPAPRRLGPIAFALWFAALPLVWLSFTRPGGVSMDRAERLPTSVAGATLVPRTAEEEARFRQSLPRWRELLGTGDFVWRRYEDASGRRVHLVALFHDANWKSVHPPRICIEGSNMVIEQDELVPMPPLGEDVVVSRIVARGRSDGWRYVTLSLFGTRGWASGDYAAFTWHHLPKALLRRSEAGFLLRVEAPIYGDEDVAAATARCLIFLQALLPLAREQL
jgi:exosortase